LEKHCSTFEQSKKLYEMGVVPEKSKGPAFVWSQNVGCEDLCLLRHVSVKPQNYIEEGIITWREYPAYLATEILEWVPCKISDPNGGSYYELMIWSIGGIAWGVDYFNGKHTILINRWISKNLAEVAMGRVFWLLDNNYLTVAEINNRGK